MKTFVYSTTALTAVLAPSLAWAQAAAPAQSAHDSGLEEIIVTAQKRSENLQQVPIAITAATAAQLESKGITNTLQLNVLSPGVSIVYTAGSFQPAIRGIGTQSTVTENPVALYIDGVYFPQQREGARELEDIEQIAILKGPQGTLFGRNATAGVIQITTKAPSFDFGGKVHAGFDNYQTLSVGAYVTGGLSDNVAASLSANYATQGKGWGNNLTTGHDTYRVAHDFSVRGKLLAKIDDDTSVTFAGDYADWKKFTMANRPLVGTQFTFVNPYTTKPVGVYDTYGRIDSFNALKGGGGSMTFNHEGDAVKLVSITAYRSSKSQYQFANAAVPQAYQESISPYSPSKSFTQEFQIISNSHGPLNWMFGLFYISYKNGADPLQRNFGGPLTPLATSNVRSFTYATEVTESVAPFGEIKYEFLPDTHLTLGGRYTYEKRKLENARVIATTAAGVTTTNNIAEKRIDFSDPTIRVALDHQFSNNLLAYASFNTGFKSGGYNTVSPTTPAYKPEKLKAYEAGFKSELLDRRLRLNVAGFYYDYTNLQVIQFVGSTQSVVNGPKAELYGVDADFVASLAEGLQLSGGFEWKHAEFTKFPGAVTWTSNPLAGPSSKSATGHRLPLAQKFSGTLAVDYHHELSSGSLDFNLTGNYNGNYKFNPDNLLTQGAYTVVNSSLTWNLPGDSVTFKIWGKNLANEHVVAAVSEQVIGFSAVYAFAPRTVGATIGVKF